MVASRNQHHVIARRMGSLPNGSMPIYFGGNELAQHINGNEIKAAVANQKRAKVGPKPRMKQYTRGQPIEHKELSTRYGWSSVSVIKDSRGKYVVEHYCPRKKGSVVDKSFDNVDEAQAYAQKITGELRDFGHSNMGFAPASLGILGMGTADGPLLIFASMVYIGLDFPGARSAAKAVKNFYDEPIPKVQAALLGVGLVGLVARQFKVI